jgi:hypothetical protein
VLNLENLRLNDPLAELGRGIFLNEGLTGPNGGDRRDAIGRPLARGKCNVCHQNMNSTTNVALFNTLCAQLARPGVITPQGIDLNRDGRSDMPPCGGTQFNFETGVEENQADIADLLTVQAVGMPLPRDGGFGRQNHATLRVPGPNGTVITIPPACRPLGGQAGFGTQFGFNFPGTTIRAGDCEESFSTPVLVEAADTGPFFHDNSVDTIELGVAFYNSEPFIRSSAGRILGSLTPPPIPARPDIPIRLEAGEQRALGAALRAVNQRNNAMLARDLVLAADTRVNIGNQARRELLRVARAEVQDIIEVGVAGQVNGNLLAALSRIADGIDDVQDSVFFDDDQLSGLANQLLNVINAIGGPVTTTSTVDLAGEEAAAN